MVGIISLGILVFKMSCIFVNTFIYVAYGQIFFKTLWAYDVESLNDIMKQIVSSENVHDLASY